MMLPLVTIITTTYRKFDFLEFTMSSVFGQDYPRIEYIVSDDGSDNFSQDVIENVINKYKGQNIENIQIIHHESNLGTVKNITLATKAANGEYIIGLGLEDRFASKSSVSQIIDRMQQKKCDILAFSRIQCSPEGIQLRKMPCIGYYKYINKMSTRQLQYRALVTGEYYEMASGSSICSRKSLLEKMDYYDLNFKYWEDGPYLAKCYREGIEIETAYDIIGLLYRLGGISSIKPKVTSKAVMGLRDDAYLFYKTELNRKPSWLSKYDRRKIKYTLERNRDGSKWGKYLIMVRYLDVVIHRAIIKLKSSLAIKKERELFVPVEDWK